MSQAKTGTVGAGGSRDKEALLKSYQKRLKDDIRAMIDNFQEILKSSKVPTADEEGQRTLQVLRQLQCTEDQYEMSVRAANMVRAGEKLVRLIADIKQYLILNDFPFINDAIQASGQRFCNVQHECDQRLMALRDDMAAELYELEEEYYSSVYKSPPTPTNK
ncbi:mediator of RNA polymerase II transcription subunit 22-like [Varroa jacobsoni]|uniref:Mediator of RNA polymerase II transcription subunit 22 n=1 Tax=Varroa destructor TaxID=109461 RepID=A0A7M7JS33_VARDE|nr:mediator of RNA polymerase II transcription subunit 22-like [Varroa destructor]XP_022693319.1 mediator of RNA polymerase II transcription subunit 22-like [Varroa jacobsoni]